MNIGIPKLTSLGGAIPMPRMVKAPTPKIAHVSVAKVNGGFTVQHHMTHGPKPVPFVFSDPRKMLTHIKRIQASQWREPERNEAPKVDRTLNIPA